MRRWRASSKQFSLFTGRQFVFSTHRLNSPHAPGSSPGRDIAQASPDTHKGTDDARALAAFVVIWNAASSFRLKLSEDC
jgi:hypothetical protein